MLFGYCNLEFKVYMCGIFGSNNHNLTKNEVKSYLETIKHRGPDSDGIFIDDNIVLGFRRLSIIDLSNRANQPIANEDNSVWLIFNGEIYNYQELKKELKSHKFRSNTDSEVLLHGYEEWGMEKLLGKINGMFAFAIYDQKKELLFLVRDRIGKKPLFYLELNDRFYFASEIKPFWQLKGFKFEIDKEMFDLWLGFPYLPNNQSSIIKGIKKIPPAHYLQFNLKDKSQKITRYYAIDNQLYPKMSFEEAKQELDKLLNQSIKQRLVSDVPLGVLLSGGLDSSLITAIASKYQQVKTINISFPGTTIDESNYAQIVAKHCQTKHTALKLSVKDDVFDDFRQNIWIFDDLSTVDAGLYSTYVMSKEIRKQGTKVVLVGEGADEVFGGYSWFGLSQMPYKMLGTYIQSLAYYYAIMRICSKSRFKKYHSFLYSKLKNYPGDFFSKVQRFEIEYSLPNHYCMKVDKGSSAASIEARAPYLDYHIVDMLASLPTDYKIKGTWNNNKKSDEKYILREVARKYLPEEIFTRKKKGGMFPVYKIMEDGLKEYRDKIIANQILLEFFSKSELALLIDNKPSFKPLAWQREWILWKLLTFTVWQEHFSKINQQ